MEKDSALYQLMDTRINGVMNGIVSSDGEYQAILRRSDEYSGRLERIGLPVDIRQLTTTTSENRTRSAPGVEYSAGHTTQKTEPLLQ